MGTRSHTKIGWSTGVLAFVLIGLLSLEAQPKPKPPGQRGVVDAASQPVAAKAPAKYYALVIGNNNYTYVNKLATPVNDATAIAQLLKTSYGFKTELLKDATRDSIMTALVRYRRELGPESNLLIYYAGHGLLDRDAAEAYWIPVDGEADNNMNWISADDITRAVRAIHAKHVLVISDSCYSGAILTDDSSMKRLESGITLRDHIAYLARLQNLKSRNWMASGGKEPVPDGTGHSRFATAVLQGLSATKEDQFTASDLFYAFVRRKVASDQPQIPQYGSIRESGDDLGDFIFSRGGAAPPDASDVPPDIDTHDLQGRTDPVIPTEMFDAQAERSLINAVLDQYKLGRSRKDGSIIWKVWPNAPMDIRQRYESYFRGAKMIRATLQMNEPEFGSDHATATIAGQMHEQYTPKEGDAPPAQDSDITFMLKKSNGMWTIVDVK